MKTQLFVGIVILIIAGLFAKYKIFDEKIELKYALSEKITSDFNDKSEEAIQQLIIKNSGDVGINSILIKIHSSVSRFQIKKFRYNDSVSYSLTTNKLEITYPELPPNGYITVILKTINSGVNANEIEIFHSKGIAKEAFSSNESYRFLSPLVFLLIYTLIIGLSMRNFYTNLYKSRIYYSPYEGILEKKKPWFISNIKWNEIRKEAIEKLFEKGYAPTIEKSKYYQILNSEKKVFLSDDEWNAVIKKAEDKFLITVSEKLYGSYYFGRYEEINNLKKPINIHHDSWNSILMQISNGICLHKMLNAIRLPHEDQLSELLRSEKPAIVSSDDWARLRAAVALLYSSLIINKWVYRYDRQEEYLKSIDLNVLADNKTDIIKLFEDITKGKNLESYYRILLRVIRNIIAFDVNQKKPEQITDKDWNELIEIVQKIIETREKSNEEFEDALKIKTEALPLMEKVTKQLDIIDKLLKEPETINKIEAYNIPFEKGNWDNLKKISEYLSKI